MGGQPAQTTNVTRNEPSREQSELLAAIMPQIRGYSATTPQRYQGSTIAPFNETQVAGQNLALGGAGLQAGLAGSGVGAVNRALNAPSSTSANIQELLSLAGPGLGARPDPTAAINAAVRPIQQNLTERALPAIQGQFGIDNWGNSGRGLAEGVAVRDTSRAIGDTAAQLSQGLYNADLGAYTAQRGQNLNLAGDVYGQDTRSMLTALGLLPQTQQSLLAPAATVAGVGDVQQSMGQAQLDELVRNFNFDQAAPFLHSQEILSLLQGLPGGATVSTGTGPRPNTLLSGLGGAATGASLGSAIFPGVGTAAGAGIGALLPFILNR